MSVPEDDQLVIIVMSTCQSGVEVERKLHRKLTLPGCQSGRGKGLEKVSLGYEG